MLTQQDVINIAQNTINSQKNIPGGFPVLDTTRRILNANFPLGVSTFLSGVVYPTDITPPLVANSFYMATTPGTYINFKDTTGASIVIGTNDGMAIISCNGIAWSKQIAPIDLSNYSTTPQVNLALENKSNKIVGKNLVDISKSTYGYFIWASGVISDNVGGIDVITDYIPVMGNTIANQALLSGRGNAVYDLNKVFLRSFSSSQYTFQAGDAYVRYSYNSTLPIQVEVGLVSTVFETYTENSFIQKQVTANTDAIINKVDKQIGKNLVDTSKAIIGYLDYLGNIAYQAGYGLTDFIPVTANVIANNNSRPGTYNAAYDSNKTFLRYFLTSQYTFQAGDAYVRYSYDPALLFQVEVGIISTSYEAYTQFSSVMASILPMIGEPVQNYPISIDKSEFTYLNQAYNGAVLQSWGFKIPIGQSGTGSLIYIYFSPKNYHRGNTYNLKFDVLTNIPAANFWIYDNISATQISAQIVRFEQIFTITDLYKFYTDTIQLGNTSDTTVERVFEVISISATAAALDGYVKLAIAENSNNYKMTTLEVSPSFSATTDGWGVNRFNSLIVAHNSINESCSNNRFTILVHPGTYSDWETTWPGVVGENPPGYLGIIVKDHVYFESTDIDHPENFILSWNGHAGFPDGYIMDDNSAFERCMFHICLWPSHTHIKGFTFNSKNTRYAIHPETAGAGLGNTYIIENCIINFGGWPNAVDVARGNGIGTGISAGDTGLIKNCTFLNNGSLALNGIGGHNNPWATQALGAPPFRIPGAKLTIENCDLGGNNIGLQSLITETRNFDEMIIKNVKNVSVIQNFPVTGLLNNWRTKIEFCDTKDTSL